MRKNTSFFSLIFHRFFEKNRRKIVQKAWKPALCTKIDEKARSERRFLAKNRFFPQKAVPGSAFLSIFAANVVFLDFLMDFWSILDEKSMKKNLFFSSPPRSFFNMATLTKHYVLRCESYFFVF